MLLLLLYGYSRYCYYYLYLHGSTSSRVSLSFLHRVPTLRYDVEGSTDIVSIIIMNRRDTIVVVKTHDIIIECVAMVYGT